MLADKASATLFPHPAPPPLALRTYRTPDPFVDRIYLRNLTSLKALTRSLSATIVFVPQVLNRSFFKGRRDSDPWTPRVENDALPELLDRMNTMMASVCHHGEQDCQVLDEVSGEDWEPADFVDEGHFSRAGGLRFATALHDRILSLPLDAERAPDRN
jgi:hypothetical protein